MRGGDQAMYLRAADLPVQTWLARHAVRLWLPLGAAFVLTHAIWYWSLTQSPVASLLGALSALTIRHSLGGDYWGLDGPSAVGTRTLHAILTPLAFLLPGWGAVVALVHPGTVWNVARSRARSAPPDGMTADQPPGCTPDPIARAAILWRFGYLFFPIDRRTLISVAAHLSLPCAVWVWMATPALWVVLAAVTSAVVGTAAIQAHSFLTHRPPLDIQQLRAFRLVYPVLCAGFAFAYAAGHYWLLPLALVPPAWLIAFVGDCLGLKETPPHLPGRDEIEGRWFKDGALAYLQGPGAMVAWWGRKP